MPSNSKDELLLSELNRCRTQRVRHHRQPRHPILERCRSNPTQRRGIRSSGADRLPVGSLRISGRAVWQEAMALHDGSERRRWLETIGVQRLNKLGQIVGEHGRPYYGGKCRAIVPVEIRDSSMQTKKFLGSDCSVKSKLSAFLSLCRTMRMFDQIVALCT